VNSEFRNAVIEHVIRKFHDEKKSIAELTLKEIHVVAKEIINLPQFMEDRHLQAMKFSKKWCRQMLRLISSGLPTEPRPINTGAVVHSIPLLNLCNTCVSNMLKMPTEADLNEQRLFLLLPPCHEKCFLDDACT
jgi:hypothetical protein